MEPVQIVLLIVIVVLTILLSVLGFQVFLILREIKKTIEKSNKVLDDAGIISESIATPVSAFSSLAMSIKTGVSFAGWIKKAYDMLLSHLPHKETNDQHENKSQKDSSSDGGAKESKFQQNSEWGYMDKMDIPTPAGSDEPEERKPLVRRFFRGIDKRQ